MTQEENDALNMQTLDKKGLQKPGNGVPKSSDPQAIMNKAAQLVTHVTQGHEGDPDSCTNCGFGMDNTVLQPSIANLKSGLQGQ